MKTDRPTPLIRDLPDSEPFPSFGNKIIDDAIEATRTISMAPRPIVANTMLGQLAIAVQALADVETLAGPAPVQIFVLTVAQSSERKSTCDRLAGKATQEVHYARVAKFRSDYKCWMLTLRDERSGGISGDVIETEGGQKKSDPKVAPVNPSILLSDVTFEGILSHWDNGNPSIGIVSDEAGQLIGGHSMRRENKLKTGAAFSRIWDGQALDRHRASTDFGSYHGKRASMCLMAQPGVANDFLTDEILSDQGMLSRLLVAFPVSLIGKRTIDDPEAHQVEVNLAKKKLQPFYDRIKALLELDPPVDPNDALVLRPPTLVLGAEARLRLTAFYNGIERGQLEGEAFAHIRGFASKIPEQACRIAAILTVFENPTPTEINLETMERAIKIADWYLIEMQRLRASGRADPEIREAERLRLWLVKYRSGQSFTCRELVRSGPKPSFNARELKISLALLEEFGWVRKLPNGSKVNGTSTSNGWMVWHE